MTTMIPLLGDLSVLLAAPEDLNLLNMIVATLDDLLRTVQAFIPKLVFAVVYFVIGYVLARVLRKLTAGGLSRLGFDGLMETLGFQQLLARLGIRAPISAILGNLLFWGILLLFLKSSADNMGVDAVSEPLNAAVLFLPKVITAIIIGLIGFLCADMCRNVIRRAAEGIGVDYAAALSNVLYGFILILITTLALRELGLDTKLIDDSVKIVLAGVGIAFSLAIGLGLRPLAQNVVSGVYARELYPPGTTVRLRGEEARVAAVGPMMTRLERDEGGFFLVPNVLLMSETVECDPS